MVFGHALPASRHMSISAALLRSAGFSPPQFVQSGEMPSRDQGRAACRNLSPHRRTSVPRRRRNAFRQVRHDSLRLASPPGATGTIGFVTDFAIRTDARTIARRADRLSAFVPQKRRWRAYLLPFFAGWSCDASDTGDAIRFGARPAAYLGRGDESFFR